ncbi:MAG: hypothetical protein ACXWQZ_12285 [Ktedonobacterales bacterium]
MLASHDTTTASNLRYRSCRARKLLAVVQQVEAAALLRHLFRWPDSMLPT